MSNYHDIDDIPLERDEILFTPAATRLDWLIPFGLIMMMIVSLTYVSCAIRTYMKAPKTVKNKLNLEDEDDFDVLFGSPKAKDTSSQLNQTKSKRK